MRVSTLFRDSCKDINGQAYVLQTLGRSAERLDGDVGFLCGRAYEFCFVAF